MISLIFLTYSLIIITSFILNYFPKYKQTSWGLKITMLADYTLNPIRKILPPDIPFDASPLLAIVGILFLKAIFHFLVLFYTVVIIADVIISFFPQYRQEGWAQIIKKIADFSLDPIRKILPHDLPFDFSPMIIIIILQLLNAAN